VVATRDQGTTYLLSCKLCTLGKTLHRCSKTLTCKCFRFVMAISICMTALGILTERRCTVFHSMSAEDIWQRKLDELWLKLEKNTQESFCTALWKWLVNSEAD
jgi:hypothetical protein